MQIVFNLHEMSTCFMGKISICYPLNSPESGKGYYDLGIKVLSKIVVDNSQTFFYYFLRENKALHFMRII